MKDSVAKLSKFWKVLAIGTALALLYSSVLIKLGSDWWTDENYSHGLLIPFVIGYIIWIEKEDLKKAIQNPAGLLGGVMVLFALLLLFAGTLGAELFLQRTSFVLMIAGIAVYFWGFRLIRMLAVPFALLLLAIPIPQIIFNKIAFPLQIWASQMAVWGIRLLEVASVRKGNIIEILPRGSTQIISLEVVEACSGIRSLMTLMTLGLVLAYFTSARRKKFTEGIFGFFSDFDFWRAVILIVAAIPIAIITNAGRVTATGVLTYYYGKQATEGFAHSSAGWAVYLVALIMLILINLLLSSLWKIFRRQEQ